MNDVRCFDALLLVDELHTSRESAAAEAQAGCRSPPPPEWTWGRERDRFEAKGWTHWLFKRGITRDLLQHKQKQSAGEGECKVGAAHRGGGAEGGAEGKYHWGKGQQAQGTGSG